MLPIRLLLPSFLCACACSFQAADTAPATPDANTPRLPAGSTIPAHHLLMTVAHGDRHDAAATTFTYHQTTTANELPTPFSIDTFPADAGENPEVSGFRCQGTILHYDKVFRIKFSQQSVDVLPTAAGQPSEFRRRSFATTVHAAPGQWVELGNMNGSFNRPGSPRDNNTLFIRIDYAPATLAKP